MIMISIKEKYYTLHHLKLLDYMFNVYCPFTCQLSVVCPASNVICNLSICRVSSVLFCVLYHVMLSMKNNQKLILSCCLILSLLPDGPIVVPMGVELPPVEELPPVIVELPPVDDELPPVIVELPPVDDELPPVIVELPPVDEELPPVIVELPPAVVELSPVVVSLAVLVARLLAAAVDPVRAGILV